MGLYDRLIGRNDAGSPVAGKIPIHSFAATLGEFARGRLTGQQAQDAITTVSGSPLTAPEVTEANTLLGTVTGTASAKLARAVEITDVLILGEHGVVQYDTPTEIKTRLGV